MTPSHHVPHGQTESPAASADMPEDEPDDSPSSGARLQPAPIDDVPARATSFGTFKPVGHVMVGLPNREALVRLKASLAEPGVPGLPADELTPTESVDEMQALIDNASPLAGFGYEITLMRRYVALAREGYCWLVVKTDSDDDAQRVGDLAKRFGATLAVRYGRLTVEDLI